MTKFSGTFSGQTSGPDMGKIGAAALVVGAGVVAYKVLGSAASTVGNVLGDVFVAAGTLAVAAVVTFVVVKVRRSRRPVSGGQPAGPQLWVANPHASPLPQRETRAIAPAPVTVINNFGADFAEEIAARVLHAAQQQAQPAPVIVPSETQELPR